MATIMIVNDSPTVLMSMENLLTRFGHRSVSADSAEDALTKVGGAKLNLIITDLHMRAKAALTSSAPCAPRPSTASRRCRS